MSNKMTNTLAASLVPPEHLSPTERHRAERLRIAAPIFTAIVALITLSVLTLWAMRTPDLQSRWPAIFVMKPNTAIGLLFNAIGLNAIFLRVRGARTITVLFTGLCLLLSILTLGEYLLQTDLRIDQLLFTDFAHVTHPGRTSLGTAVCLLLVSVAILLNSAHRATKVSQFLFFIAASAPLAALGGYLYRAPGLASSTTVPIIAFHTAVCQILLSLAGLISRSDEGLMRVVISESLAGSVARKLLPLSVVLPIIVGLLALLGIRSEFFGVEFGSALLVSCCALLFAAAVWLTTSLLWRTEKTRTIAETRFRQLADAMPQFVWTANPDGEVDYYNRRWFEYLDLSPYALRDAQWHRFCHPDDLQQAYNGWREAIHTGQPFEQEFRFRRADGAFRWFLVRAVPIRDDEKVVTRWFGTCTDIQDRKEFETEREYFLGAERAARSDAERANTMKDEFLATLSHELRTPLNAILGWTHILAGAMPPEEVLKEGIATIDRNAHAQRQIIEDLLDMSRISTGKATLNYEAANIHETIKSAVQAVQKSADGKGISLETDIAANQASVVIDSLRIQQILLNLLTNAIKFTPNGGTVRLSITTTDSLLTIRVNDNGEGIDPSFLPHIFDRFRQANSTITRRHGGLGLGLALVKELVELHRGTVDAASEGIGKGTTVTITLPLPTPQPEAISPALNGASDTAVTKPKNGRRELDGMRILVVDDEADTRNTLKRLLENFHGIVTTASSVQEALTLMQGAIFDVLVSDIGMPEEDGYSLIKRVRSLDKESVRDIPAIALTAYARAEDRKRAIIAGFHKHVSKPIEPIELISIVAEAGNREEVH